MVRPRKRQALAPPKSTEPPGLDVNAVVSYNVKAIRERRGMTQQQVAERLAQLTGHQLPQASISAMERGFDGERRRRFDAHELYLLSMVFDVPIAYFFIPPPGTGMGELADTRRPIAELCRSCSAPRTSSTPSTSGSPRSRSRTPRRPTTCSPPSSVPKTRVRNWHEHFRTWRKSRLREIEVEYGDQLDEVADFLAEFAAKVKALGPAGYLQSTAHRAGESVHLDEEAQ